MMGDAPAGKGRLFLRNRIELNDLIRDPGIGLVFYYQLLVALQGSKVRFGFASYASSAPSHTPAF